MSALSGRNPLRLGALAAHDPALTIRQFEIAPLRLDALAELH